MEAKETEAFVFVYEKYGQIKVLSLEDSKRQHNNLISKGWKHMHTIDPCVFLQYLHNDAASNGDIVEEIRSLSQNSQIE